MKRELGSVTSFVADLWQIRTSGLHIPTAKVHALRCQLFRAISQEMQWRIDESACPYDADDDVRVTWARQFLHHQEDSRRAIDPATEACAEALIDRSPRPLSHKDLASGETVAA
jgi:hypothetical protein